jgi:hypothetical protein
MEIGSSPAFCPLSTSLASDPSSQMSSPGWIRRDGPGRGRRTQCPDKASRGATRSQITTETIASSMAITMRTRNARLSAVYPRALSPRQPNHSASAAERIAFLNSARSARRSTRLAPNRRLANRNRVCHVAKFRASPAGLYRSPTPQRTAIHHVQSLVTKAAKTSAATSPVISSNARASGCIGLDPSAQGGSPPNPSEVTNPGCLTGRPEQIATLLIFL